MVRKIDKIPEHALSKKLCAAIKEIDVHHDLHNTIRNDPNWAGHITHCRVTGDYRRFVYTLKDNSKIFVSHSVDKQGQHQVEVRAIG